MGIINNESPKSAYSYHIFLFPFQWNFKKKDKPIENMDFLERTDLENIDSLLENSCWEREYFTLDQPAKFNEFIYFYDFVRDALYDSWGKKPGILHQYKYTLPENSRYIIHIQNKNSYDLKIDKILLSIYSTGVGVLSYHLSNQSHSICQEILEINEYGRRIYPQFLREKSFTHDTKNAFLAHQLEINIDENRKFKEDFSHFDNISQVKENPTRLSSTIMSLLGDDFMTERQENHKQVLISPILDDRMFVLCWFADKKLCSRLAAYNKKKETYRYAEDDDWYKLVFIDKESPSCKSIPMKKKLLLNHTYDRWIGKKECSLFGITRNSFIQLNDGPSFVKEHLKTMYFQMVQLALVQRASVLRFSHEATRIAGLEKPGETVSQSQQIHQKYLEFVNKIYFREVTAQEQGIELYEHIQKHMNIERDVKDLNAEIDELHQYAAMETDRRRNKLLNMLSILGALFLVPAFITGFFGMNVIPDEMGINNTGGFISVTFGIVLTAALGLIFLGLRNKSEGTKLKRKEKFLLGIIGFIIILLLFMPLWMNIFKGVV